MISAERRAAHHCHALLPGFLACPTPTKPEMLMCSKHWRMVPKELQRRVWETYRVGQCDDMSPSRVWCEAADAAIKAVFQRLDDLANKRADYLAAQQKKQLIQEQLSQSELAVSDETNKLLLPVAWDLETFMPRVGTLAPEIVCVSFAHRDETGNVQTGLVGNATEAELDNTFDSLINDHGVLQILCNAPYDLSCVAARDPERLPAIFQAIEDGRVDDVATREKLLQLALTGNLSFVELPDGSNMRMDYGLAELEKYCLGWDRSADKEGEDAPRANYSSVSGLDISEWPASFRDYSMKDSEGTLLVWEDQERRRKEFLNAHGFDPLKVQSFRVGLAFALRLITCQGVPTDPGKVAEIKALVEEELAPERLSHLIEAGILQPAEAPKQRKNGTFTKGRPEKLSNTKLHALIAEVCTKKGIAVPRNELTASAQEKGKVEGSVCADKEVMEDLWPLHPALEEYRHRQSLTTCKNKELPPLEGATLVYSSYNEVLETGRTSSRGKGFSPDIPAVQIQNYTRIKKVKDRDGTERGEIDVRQCHVARPGWVLYSNDYPQIEFVSAAQKCYELFGESRMRDLLLAGVDPHAHLGSRMAYRMSPEFRAACDELGVMDDEGIREVFVTLKKSEDQAERDFFKEWRQFAKPPGFAAWGGMGPARFVDYCKRDHGIVITEDTAREVLGITKETYPEMGLWFRHVESALQIANGEFAYMSPLGMWRGQCRYTDACNGALLQTPATGEGAPLAVWHVVRACYDSSVGNDLLYGTHVLAFGHDELIGEVPLDGYEHERVHEVARLMEVSMGLIMKDVPFKVEPCLMERWSKKAETKYNEKTKRLEVWRPAA